MTRDPRTEIAAWFWHEDDTQALEDADALLAALKAAGFRICSDGEAVVGSEVVHLSEPWERTRSFGGDSGPTAEWVWQASKVLPMGVTP